MANFNLLMRYYNNKPYKRELAYLESTGTQWIDTGVKPDFANGDSIEINSYIADFSSPAPCIFGSRSVTVTNGAYWLADTFVAADTDGYSTIATALKGKNHILSVNDLTVMVDNISYNMPRHVTSDYSIFLFSLNNVGNTLGNYTGLKIYYWKYYHNGVLAQHLIPVLDYNNVPCMYDKVSNQLFYNQGTGQLLYGEKLYQRELSYLESTGTQYIDTGYVFDVNEKNSELKIKFYIPSNATGNNVPFGARQQSDGKNSLYMIGYNLIVGDSEGATVEYNVI